MERNTWYKDKKEGKSGGRRQPFLKDGKDKTVIFVPSTKDGKLTKMLKEKEEELAKLTKFKIRYQEAGGTKLAMMFSTDLAAGEACGREDCQPCGSRAEKRPNCRSESILYESSCVECNPD